MTAPHPRLKNALMSQSTRREFIRTSLVGASASSVGRRLVAHEAINSRVSGVLLGAQSYSFRDRDVGQAIQDMARVGLGEVELWMGHMERGHGGRGEEGREALRKWRMKVPLDEFEAVGRKFHQAGIDVYAYNYSFREDMSDGEIERGFEMAQALGARVITASANVSTASRIDPFARRYQMRVGMHNHSNFRKNEFTSPADFDVAMKGNSDYIAINLDIGHFTAAGFDAVDYLSRRYDEIVTLHIKDRKRDQGDNMPFGQGDSPIVEALQLLRDKKLAIPANIEYEYKGEDTVEEVRRCLAYCKKALEGPV